MIGFFAAFAVGSCDSSTEGGDGIDLSSNDDSGGGGGSDGGGGGGPTITTEVVVVDNTVLDEQLGQGRNGPGTSEFDQLAGNRRGYTAYSAWSVSSLDPA